LTKNKMTDSELASLIDRQCESAIGAEDFYAQQRRTAMEFYMGEAKGELAPPEVEGRSTVVSKDLMETVEWAMPAIMEALTGADDVVSFRPRRPGDEDAADDATAYVNHLLYEENEGFVTLHDAIKQSLIGRFGVGKVYCDDSWEEKKETYEGLSAEEVQALQADADIEIESVELMGMVQPEGMVEGASPEQFSVVAKRRENLRRFVVEGVPPEEFRVSKDARTLITAEFVAHEVQRTASDLISEGWPREEVERLPRGRNYRTMSDDASRHGYDGSWAMDSDDGDRSQEKIVVTEAYIRVDTDRDGVAELRRVKKAGDYIHENEVTDDHPFFLFTPILMPYKIIGLSMHDMIEDLVRIKTALTRQVLDNVYLSNTPMMGVVEGQINLDDVLNPRPGGIVRMKNPDAIKQLSVPFVAGAGLQLLEFVNQVRDTRSGVTEMNSALNADSLSKGAIGSEGVQAMQEAGSQRIRLIARVLAETGVKRLYMLLLKHATKYQDRPAQVQVNGRWLQVDPREWVHGFRLRVNVGVGALEKRQQVANLTMLGQIQERLSPVGIVKPQNVHATATDLVKAMGYHDPERYFSTPDENPRPPPPPIELQLEQMKQQGAAALAQAKAQHEQALAQIEGNVKVQVEQMTQHYQGQQALEETRLEAQRNAAQMQNEKELEIFRTQEETKRLLIKAGIDQGTAITTAEIKADAAVTSSANKQPKPESSFGQD
jgi:hypothetical protein